MDTFVIVGLACVTPGVLLIVFAIVAAWRAKRG